MKKKIALFIHNHYENSIDYLLGYINLSNELGFQLLVNTSNTSIAPLLKQKLSNSTIIQSPNKGKDIGGKLALIDLALKLNIQSDYYIFLHDKQSPHTSLGDAWRKKLYRIIEPENISKIIKIFDNEKKTGIVCAKEFITNEYDKNKDEFTCTSNMQLKELLQKHQLKPKSFDFVGGTMFWIRADIINSFFKKNNPLEIRATLEEGNVLDHEKGSITHSWERMLSWIASDQGYTIKGI